MVTLTNNLAGSPNLVKWDSGCDLPRPSLQQEEPLVRKAMLLTAQKSYSADWQILYESHSDVRIAQGPFGGASEQVRRSFDVVQGRVNEADANYAVDVEVDCSRMCRSCCVGIVHGTCKRSFLAVCLPLAVSFVHEVDNHSLVN